MSHFNHETVVDMPNSPELDQVTMELKELHSEMSALSLYHRLYLYMFIMESVLDEWFELITGGLPKMLDIIDTALGEPQAQIFHTLFRALVEDFNTVVSLSKNSAETLTRPLLVGALGEDVVDAAAEDAELADTMASVMSRLHDVQTRFQAALSNSDLDLSSHGAALRLRTQESPADDDLPPLETDA